VFGPKSVSGKCKTSSPFDLKEDSRDGSGDRSRHFLVFIQLLFGECVKCCKGGICRGKPGNFPSLDLTFRPTGLCENLGGIERGRGGKGEREGWGDHLPYFPPMASASNTTLPTICCDRKFHAYSSIIFVYFYCVST